MDDGTAHSTLRQWRRHMAQPVTLAALAGIAGVLMLAGPFDTDALLRPLPRLAYWLAMAAATYGAGVLTDLLMQRPLRRLGRLARGLLVALAVGAVVSVVVPALNLAALGHWPRAADLPVFMATVGGIAVIVTLLLSLTGDQPGTETAPPPLLDRLPLDKRGPLVALSVEDHYVLIRTTRGSDLLLMRLTDAMREVGGTPGAQVHRSHWVAWDQVTAARREGDRAILTVTGGTEIPVSRANLPRIKEAGLLPR